MSTARLDWTLFLKAAVIFIAGYLAVEPSLGGGWLWDDSEQVTANMMLRSTHGLWRIWFAPVEADYYPLKSTVLWGLWHLWGPSPMGYRLFSLGCHLASALLIWRLLAAVGLSWGWMGGLFFAIHPLTVESVAWISEIKNTLSLPFLLISMLCFINYDNTRRGRALAWAVLCFLAAMLCKSSVVMLPAVLLLYCWWKRGTLSWRDFISALPFALISLVLGCVTIWFQHTRAIADNPIPSMALLARFAGAGTNTWFYIGKTVFPAGLSPLYPQWSVEPPGIWQLLSVPALCALLWWCWTRRTRWGRHALLGLGFFLLNLLPVLGFLKMSFMAFSWVSDHFVYVPMIGLLGLAVAAAEINFRRLPELGRAAELAAIGALAVLCVMLSSAHAAIFQNKERLWTAALRISPHSAAAHSSLGGVYADEGRLPEAMTHIREALRIRPDYASARNNLGLALRKAGHHEEALAEFREALRLDPRLVSARNNAGDILLARKQLPEAANEFRQAIAVDGNCTSAHNNLGIALVMQDQLSEALKEFQIALTIDPTSDEAHGNFGMALALAGRKEEASVELKKALKLNPRNTNAATALGALNRPPATQANPASGDSEAPRPSSR